MKLNRILDTTLCLILAVSFLCVCPSRISANPDVRAVKIAEAKGRLFVLAIGIDHYVSAKLARLQLAGKDAREIAALLEKNADGVFDSTHKRVLLDETATKRNIEAALDEFSRDIRAQDTFVFFYAGFGDKSNDNTDFYFNAGVLWEPRVRVVKQVGHLNDRPANHIRDERSPDRFAAANSSFSDTPFFDGGWASGLLPAQRQTKDEYGEISRDEYILRVMNHRTRKLLTSGGNVPVPDGRVEKHSPFVSKLLQALEDNREKYGVLTSNDIYTYVNLITPQPFQGHLSDSDGEFVFIRRDATR